MMEVMAIAMVVVLGLVAMMAHDYQASLEEINNYIIIVAPSLSSWSTKWLAKCKSAKIWKEEEDDNNNTNIKLLRM